MTATNIQNLDDQISQAKEQMSLAAGQGYAAFAAAKSALAKLVAQRDASMPATPVYVVGNTYAHRKALSSIGLKWDAGHKAWIGMLTQAAIDSLPRGCSVVSRGDAAMQSMDSEYSVY